MRITNSTIESGRSLIERGSSTPARMVDAGIQHVLSQATMIVIAIPDFYIYDNGNNEDADYKRLVEIANLMSFEYPEVEAGEEKNPIVETDGQAREQIKKFLEKNGEKFKPELEVEDTEEIWTKWRERVSSLSENNGHYTEQINAAVTTGIELIDQLRDITAGADLPELKPVNVGQLGYNFLGKISAAL